MKRTTEDNFAVVDAVLKNHPNWVTKTGWVLLDEHAEVSRWPDHVRTHFQIRHVASGLTISFTFNPYNAKDRISICYSRPRSSDGTYVTVWQADARGFDGKVEDPCITVALDKNPDAISKDIERRLLPDAISLDRMVRERIAQEDAFRSKKNDLITKVANLCKAPVQKLNPVEFKSMINVFTGIKDHHGKVGYGDARINAEDSIDLDLKSLKPDLALEIIKLIRSRVEA
jgi:hypothetical protein